MLTFSLVAALVMHPGGLDAQGCHTNRKTGEQHCHEQACKGFKHNTKAFVERVIDGDTLSLRIDSKIVSIRMQGIDCPESKRNQKCLRDGEVQCAANIVKGKLAAKRTAELAKRKSIVLEATNGKCLELDKYFRPLAYVRLEDGRDLGEVLVSEGLCADYSHRYPHPRSADYLAAAKPRENPVPAPGQ